MKWLMRILSFAGFFCLGAFLQMHYNGISISILRWISMLFATGMSILLSVLFEKEQS